MSPSAERFQQQTTPWRDRLLSAALRQASNRQRAEDWVQESLLRAWKAFSSLERQASIYPWLLKILQSVIADDMRKESRREFLAPVVFVDDSDLQNHPSMRPGPFESVIRQQQNDHLLAAIQTLSSDFQSVLLLADVEGLSYQEISFVLSIPKGTVMSRLSRARKMLAVRLVRSMESGERHSAEGVSSGGKREKFF